MQHFVTIRLKSPRLLPSTRPLRSTPGVAAIGERGSPSKVRSCSLETAGVYVCLGIVVNAAMGLGSGPVVLLSRCPLFAGMLYCVTSSIQAMSALDCSAICRQASTASVGVPSDDGQSTTTNRSPQPPLGRGMSSSNTSDAGEPLGVDSIHFTLPYRFGCGTILRPELQMADQADRTGKNPLVRSGQHFMHSSDGWS